MSETRDGWTHLVVHCPTAATRTTYQTFERNAEGFWHVTYELRDGKAVEVRRVDASGMRL